jgi:hypothetical protein
MLAKQFSDSTNAQIYSRYETVYLESPVLNRSRDHHHTNDRGELICFSPTIFPGCDGPDHVTILIEGGEWASL